MLDDLGASGAWTVGGSSQLLRGELDWIVMKALEKDRNRRYESASAFAADVQRYLNDEAVEACPPSAGYRLRKFTWRNRRALVTAGVIAVALVAATVVSAWQAVLARDALHQAEADRDREKTAQGEAEAAKREATTEAAVARAVNSFLQEDLLGQVSRPPQDNEEAKEDPNLTVREALQRASAKVAKRFRAQPVVEAAIRMAIGEAYSGLGEHRLAAKHLERAVELRQAHLGPHHKETLRSMQSLAGAYTWIGRGADAVVLYEQLLENTKTRVGTNDSELVDGMKQLAMSYRRAGEWKKAMGLLEQAIEKDEALRGPIAAGALDSAMILAMIYQDAGLYLESAARLDKVYEFRKRTGGSYDFYLMTIRALAYQRAGRLDEADHVLRDLLERRRKRRESNGADRAGSYARIAESERASAKPTRRGRTAGARGAGALRENPHHGP